MNQQQDFPAVHNLIGDVSLYDYQDILVSAPIGIFISTPDGKYLSANPAYAKMLGFESPQVLIDTITDIAKQLYVNPRDRNRFKELLKDHGELINHECQYRHRDGSTVWVSLNVKVRRDPDGNIAHYVGFMADITERKQAEEKLKQIEWMLSRKPMSSIAARAAVHDQGYGDLTELNRDGIILKSIGRERLKSFAGDYLELLGTSSAIYEATGDYAFGIFASGWCRMMDRASRRLCHTPDNVEALNSGRWLCHESCWTDCSKKAIAKGAPMDIECNGGIRLYAAPIFAGGKVIGAINFGYGDPPNDPDKLKMLADTYQLDYDNLVREATAYDSRPPYIIEMAKSRLNSTAKLIGSMIETKQALEALRESELRFKALHNASFGGIAIHDKGVILECNLGLSEISGFGYDELIGMDGLLLIAENSRETVMHNIRSGSEKPYEVFGVRRNEEEYPARLEARNIPYKGKMVRVVEFRDITEQKRAEQEYDKLQEQLTQAQKLESVGRLAGGVAHDFNNMLGVILGFSEMALNFAEPSEPIQKCLNEIRKSAERSAQLVQQLLAFARKQIIAPVVLDLNATVTGMLRMLQRLIGEDIDMVWRPGSSLWTVCMDPGQIDQILVNLFVNARDAISGVGKITIETANHVFDEAYCARHAGFLPGDFVLMAVSDNGCGMDQLTLTHIFEPFFTTKEVGQGTGLGLATIYGIVKQNNGFINIYSEPGRGTSVKIYLPRHKAATEAAAEPASAPIRHGSETILLVEDEPSLLEMAIQMLAIWGYRVLAAGTPGEALRLAHEHSGPIDLLMTDVVMPEMNGRDLARELMSRHPELKCLFMSGYTANVIAHHGVLDQGVHFIQKPFAMQALNAKVREVLA